MWIFKKPLKPKDSFDYGERIDIICDCCGKSCMKTQAVPFYKPRTPECACFDAMWGKRKKADIDGDIWHCDLCEDCALQVKSFIERLGGKVIIGHHGRGKITDLPCYMKHSQNT